MPSARTQIEMKGSARNRAFFGIVVLILLVIGFLLTQRGPNLPADFEKGTAGRDVTIEVANGASGSEIAMVLYSKGVVASSEAFFAAAVVDSRSAQIAPGAHRISTHITATEALEQLLDPTRIVNLIKILEGARTSEIIKQLSENGFNRNELKAALSGVKLPTGYSGSEGVFFPAQYSFGSATTALEALQFMVNKFATEVKVAELSTGSSDFSAMELLIIASLVQAEGDSQDFAKISRVVRNRLKIGMPLQFDSTVHFITGTRGQVFLSTQSTTIASPYNTYQHYGLPPGPIGNPGKAAMVAAKYPVDGDWLYFITVKPGDTRFTSSHDQFLNWKIEYQRNLRDGAFRNTK